MPILTGCWQMSTGSTMREVRKEDENPNAPPAMWDDAGRTTADAFPGADFWLEGVVPASDLRHATRLAVLHPVAAHLLFGGIAAVFAALVIALKAYRAEVDVLRATLQIVTGAGVLAAMGYLYRRQTEKSKAANQVQRLVINADGIHTANGAENIFRRWSAFKKFRASNRVVLLYFEDNPSFVRVFSRALFPRDGEWFRFLDFVAGKLPRG